MSLHVTSTYQLKPGTPQKVVKRYKKALRDFVKHVQDDQPDTWLYTVMMSQENPPSFLHYAIYKNEKARKKHQNDPKVKDTKKIIGDYIQSPPGFVSVVRDLVATQSTLTKPTGP